VSGAIKLDYLAKGVRKSVVPHKVGGLGLRLTFSSSKTCHRLADVLSSGYLM
jgi:hypothetical protein